MKIANIYNDFEDIRMDVMWDLKSKEITYLNCETGEEWSSGETADTIEQAIDDTYARYCYGWDLKFEEL